MAEAQRGAELRRWKTGYVEGWAAAVEHVEDLGLPDSATEALAATLKVLTAWRDDEARAVPPSFEGVDTCRGLGRRERFLLDALSKTGGFYLRHVATTDAEYQALWRAAKKMGLASTTIRKGRSATRDRLWIGDGEPFDSLANINRLGRSDLGKWNDEAERYARSIIKILRLEKGEMAGALQHLDRWWYGHFAAHVPPPSALAGVTP
jgi:hypothetical protein